MRFTASETCESFRHGRDTFGHGEQLFDFGGINNKQFHLSDSFSKYDRPAQPLSGLGRGFAPAEMDSRNKRAQAPFLTASIQRSGN